MKKTKIGNRERRASVRGNIRPVSIDDITYSSVSEAYVKSPVSRNVIKARLSNPKDTKAYYVGFPKDKPLYDSGYGL